MTDVAREKLAIAIPAASPSSSQNSGAQIASAMFIRTLGYIKNVRNSRKFYENARRAEDCESEIVGCKSSIRSTLERKLACTRDSEIYIKCRSWHNLTLPDGQGNSSEFKRYPSRIPGTYLGENGFLWPGSRVSGTARAGQASGGRRPSVYPHDGVYRWELFRVVLRVSRGGGWDKYPAHMMAAGGGWRVVGDGRVWRRMAVRLAESAVADLTPASGCSHAPPAL